jgi:hypothetical protein
MNAPLLFLDVDGVLCPEGSAPQHAVWHEAGADSVWWMPDMVKPLRRLRETFEFVWSTWWEERAAPVVGMLYDLPGMPYLLISEQFKTEQDLESDFPRGMFDWKVPAMAKYAGDRPFAWVDDQISDEAKKWAHERWFEQGIPTMFHRVDPRVGLRPDAAELIEMWGDAVDRSSGPC